MNSYDIDGFCYVKGVLTPQQCNDITQRLFEAHIQNKCVNDDVCPLSDSIPNIVDDYLESLIPFFEKELGIQLYPTYSYARIYRYGEVLQPHKDRPACEYTASTTISYKGSGIWPIYTKDRFGATVKAIIDPGDSLIFDGCELEHWREKYTEGDWQVQVFFHYVNANGPYSEWKYDKLR